MQLSAYLPKGSYRVYNANYISLCLSGFFLLMEDVKFLSWENQGTHRDYTWGHL